MICPSCHTKLRPSRPSSVYRCAECGQTFKANSRQGLNLGLKVGLNVGLDGLSSMRAATRTGMTFVGPVMGHAGGGVGVGLGARAEVEGFKPEVIAPDPEAKADREAMRALLRTKRDDLLDILTDLEASSDELMLAEARLVREQIARLEGGRGKRV